MSIIRVSRGGSIILIRSSRTGLTTGNNILNWINAEAESIGETDIVKRVEGGSLSRPTLEGDCLCRGRC